LTLDGKLIPVHWDDGDTFSTPDRSIRARLAGYNTLESYGPVHRWGDWTTRELMGLAKAAGTRAASEAWTCTTLEGGGGYGRISVDCPDLRRALLEEGLAHAFSVDGPAAPADVAAQGKGIAAKAGMWAKGVPEGIVTSVHSLDEKDGATSTYDRVCSTKTGAAPKVEHAKIHAACAEVCHQGSCLVYVPYKQRYGDARAECLR
jgi:endonuclease YncB( thermonuclease family)